jgi:hypothetical protein
MTEHEESEMAMPATRSVVTAAEAEPSQDLFALLDTMDLPRGARAEILDGKSITVSPTPSGLHQENVYLLDEQVRAHVPRGHRTEGHLEIRMPDLGRCVIPDLFVAPRDVLRTGDHAVPPDEVALVAEVVSYGSVRQDRVQKVGVYARARIGVYLLVDPIAGTTTLFTNSDGATYKDTVVRDFGEKLVVPDPFGFDLDTSAFLPYGTPGGSTA